MPAYFTKYCATAMKDGVVDAIAIESPNISTNPIMAMGCWQCLSLSVVQLKGKHCRKPHCRNGVVDTFRK